MEYKTSWIYSICYLHAEGCSDGAGADQHHHRLLAGGGPGPFQDSGHISRENCARVGKKK